MNLSSETERKEKAQRFLDSFGIALRNLLFLQPNPF